MKIRNLWKACMTLGLGAALVFGGGTVQAAERPVVDYAEAETQERAGVKRSAAKGAESGAEVQEIKLTGDMELPLTASKTVNPGETLCFKITVEEGGWYTFGGDGREKYYGEIEDDEHEYVVSDWGFQMDAELLANAVYYLYVEPDDDMTEEDTFTLTVRKATFRVDGDDEQTITIPLEEIDEQRTISANIIQLDDRAQLSYQWYQADTATNQYDIIPGATEKEYVLDGVQPWEELQCRISDGEVTKEIYVFVRINSGLSVDTEQEYILVQPGGSAALKINVTNPSGGELKFYWYQRIEDENGLNMVDLPDVTGDTLIIENVSISREYGCYVNDGYMSEVISFYVKADSGLTVDYESEPYVYPGDDLELSVAASTEYGTLSYQWYREKEDTEEYEMIAGATEDHYVCKDIRNKQKYMCKVTDGYNTDEALFVIYLDTDLSVEAETYYRAKPGESVTVKLKASSSYGELTYQWYDPDGELIEGAVSDSYTIDTVTRTEYYSYIVKDDYCSWSGYFTIQVDSGFDVSYENEQTIKYGTGVLNLTVNAVTEIGQLTYQWYDENNELIPGAEESSYLLKNVTSEKNYSCFVDDGYNDLWVFFHVTVDTGLKVSGGGDIYVGLGKDTVLQIDAATEVGEITYEWYKGEEEEGEDKYLEEVTGNQLEVKNVESYQYYCCYVSDGINTREVRFWIYVDSGFQADARTMYFADKGEKVTLTVNAQTNDGSLSYIWEKYNGEDYEMVAEGPTLQITASGACETYLCSVSDTYDEDMFTVTVIPARPLEGTLKEGDNRLSAPEVEKLYYIPFVPKKTGTYKFCSVEDKSTYGYLLDSGFQTLDISMGNLWSMRGGGGYWAKDFSIEYPLKAGVTYYLGVYYQLPEDVGMMTVNVSYLSEAFECDHPYLTDWIVTQEATCTHGKKQEKRCTVCGQVRKNENFQTLLNHSFGNWTVTTAATAEREGLESRTCTMCGRKETRRIAKLSSYVRLKADNLPLKVKQSFNLTKALEKAKGDTVVSWSSTNPKVAAVNRKGKVVGKKKGTATITVKMRSGATASVKVKVQKNAVKTKKVKVSKKKITLKKGKSQKIKTEITPLTSQDKVKYSSSNKKVAVVSAKGKITAKKPGKAKITVRSGRKRAVIKVTVR